jgi:hypothetical protein
MPRRTGIWCAIDEVLTSCGRALTDPRDEIMAAIPDSGLPVGMDWSRPA